ncbi:MAG: hypothetical protein JRE40_07640 [Deltaproteobacteria bacterium]|nr:hypothetical protein [Deltaproteobacteria bacterium]
MDEELKKTEERLFDMFRKLGVDERDIARVALDRKDAFWMADKCRPEALTHLSFINIALTEIEDSLWEKTKAEKIRYDDWRTATLEAIRYRRMVEEKLARKLEGCGCRWIE